jgi:hypothetical protein
MWNSMPSTKPCVVPNSSSMLGMPSRKWPSSLMPRLLYCTYGLTIKAPASALVGGSLGRNRNSGAEKAWSNTDGSRATLAFLAMKWRMLW